MSENKKKRFMFQRVIWLCTGVIFGIIFMLMDISGSKSFVDFYDGGDVYDVTVFHRNGEAFGMEYRPAEEKFVVLEQEAYKYCLLSEMEKEWDYLFMELSSVSPSPLLVQIDYFDLSGNQVFSQEALLHDGRNEIRTENVSYAGIYIWIRNQAGAGISFDKMWFREKQLEVHWGRSVMIFCAALILYLVVTLTIKKLWKRFGKKTPDWYVLIDFLQGFYQIVGERLGKKVLRISEKNRSRMRTGLLLFHILYMQIIADFGMYESNQYYKIQILIGTALVFLLGVLCYEGRGIERKNWKNKLVWSWTTLWILACISDFFVGKRYIFMGYIMLFVFGFFIFMWNQMKRKEQLIQEIICAILLSFLITGLFCFLCRPATEGMRYLGSYYSPGMFAMYMLFVWVAFLGDLCCKIHKPKLPPVVFLEAAGIALAGFFLWKTQSSSGVLPAALSVMIFLFYQFGLSKSAKIRKKTVLVLLSVCLLAVPVWIASDWGLTNIPGLLGTQIQLEKDQDFTASASHIFETDHIYAAQSGENSDNSSKSDSRIMNKLFGKQSLEVLTSNRNFYWLAYLRETNLIGHSGKVVLWGANRWPHSGFLAIMHRYGVFAIIPYIVMVFSNLWYAWKQMVRRRHPYGYFVFAALACAWVLILMENLELPYLFLCWIVMYLLMGFHFESEE